MVVQSDVVSQSELAKEKNIRFFLDNIAGYRESVGKLDTYAEIRRRVNDAVSGIDRLLDIGNGGVFDYDTSLVREIVALDLFFSEIPEAMLMEVFPANVSPRTGSALAIPEPNASFDGVLMVMLIHHLVGDSVSQCLANVRGAIAEAWRVLRPGGRLIIVESCVAPWFYAFERLVYRPASAVIGAIMDHPPTLQYPPRILGALIREVAGAVCARQVPLGRWVLQYGVKWPAALAPISAYLFTASKPDKLFVRPRAPDPTQ